MMSDTLRVGDAVSWSGGFGMEAHREATVVGIQVNYSNGSKDGVAVDEIDWWHIQERNQIIDLDNGHWAWAFQIKPIEEYV
jgi:hypothetical protein|tara:strand:+ start:700 stop:942 length:243 start_codon:yes stop_codon:yes gene_type:complete